MIHRFKPETQDKKKRARQIYWATWAAVSAGFLLGGPLLAFWLGHQTPGWYFSIGYLYIMLANAAAAVACRLARVSQEGETHEVIERDARAALVPFLGAPPEFDVKVMLWRQATVDREGIEATHTDGKWRRVLWRDVESCTFSGERNALGHYTSATLTLQGSEELPLLQGATASHDADKILAAIRFYLRGESPGLAAST